MSKAIARRGIMLVLSSPSGAGKTTIASRLLEDPGIELSISHTTRPKRKGEKDGKDYHFVDRETFTRLRDQDAFLEWAVVFDNYYGTTRKPVEEALAAGRDVLFDVDWQGARKLRESAKDDVVAVFILPPSAAALEQRLRTRAEDSDDVVKRRMRGASNEIQHWEEYDYVVVNTDIDQSVASVRAILAAERLRRTRLSGLKGFVQTLLATL
ncbi:guanylate kinase [Methyloceanibacter sp.]|uniref:guanylate kinase n=1 Tax=Methyloceanibacter sp. TaxID=1965321 RepID=UPI002D3DCDE6|nr:guanylate kinase [Methyloceanibacter sp.]HZP07991.1 guanylate kinase [Methyloceanibacter sp.]